MSSTDSGSDTKEKHGDGTLRRIKKHPKTALECFEFIAHVRTRCGALQPTEDTFSRAGIRSAFLYPAILEKRNPSMEEVATKDSEMGILIRGFAAAACRSWSSGRRNETAKNNPWQLERIRELTSFFRDVASSYVNFAVVPTRSVLSNCEAFVKSIETTLEQAAAKIEQLDCDLAYKQNGPRASRLLQNTTSFMASDFPVNMQSAVKQINKMGTTGGFRRERDDDDDGRGHDRGGWSQRGRGGRGAQGGRGRAGPGSPGWVVHVPGICSKCKKSFTGNFRDHVCG